MGLLYYLTNAVFVRSNLHGCKNYINNYLPIYIMNNVLGLFLYTLFYYQMNNMLKPCLYDKFAVFKEEPIVFYPILYSTNVFILYIFLTLNVNLIIFSKIRKPALYALSLIYLKYIIDIVIDTNAIVVYQYEFRRSIMWLFTTPLILHLYCDMNNITIMDINAHYHIISNFAHILLFPFRKTYYNAYIIMLLSVLEVYFIYKLLHFKHHRYTTFIVFIWCLFSFINILELINIFNIHDIQMCYLMSDMLAKLTTILIVNDYEEQTYFIKSNVDLQSINLITAIKKSIKHFENSTNITSKCQMVMNLIENKLTSFIPTDKTTLKLELLKKILPLELEDNYLTQTKEYKPYDFICVLFTDIVSYTEMAKRYDADIIYKLLNDVYTRFDDIINKYENLQKIETIGDAYMVVSDIYTNDQRNNVKNTILFAFDILREIKTIPTPDGVPLQLRIGINLGKVVVGILGVEIPRLCIIGNTVNVANRLQTTTEPDTIQISTHVYEIAKEKMEDVHFEEKKNVFLKNLGSRTTYIISPSTQQLFNAIKTKQDDAS
jgi:class 3 adenylate cyclase